VTYLNRLREWEKGELAEALEYLEAGNLLDYRDKQGREWPQWAIGTVCKALRQQQAAPPEAGPELVGATREQVEEALRMALDRFLQRRQSPRQDDDGMPGAADCAIEAFWEALDQEPPPEEKGGNPQTDWHVIAGAYHRAQLAAEEAAEKYKGLMHQARRERDNFRAQANLRGEACDFNVYLNRQLEAVMDERDQVRAEVEQARCREEDL
jgi:hypothetical protein